MVVALDIGLPSTFSECRIEVLMLTMEFPQSSEPLGREPSAVEEFYSIAFAHGEMPRQYTRE